MSPRFQKIPAAQYHADSIGEERPALSASIAKVLVSQSPFHAWLHHPKLGGVVREATPAMARGSLIHALVFDQPADEFVVIDADSYRTKDAQAKRDHAIAEGATPILQREFDDAAAVAYQVQTLIIQEGFPLTGQSEMTAVWEEASEFGPVLCRGMLDHIHLDTGLILDLKTTTNASPKAIERSMIDLGYHVQHAAYTSAFRHAFPDMAGREHLKFLFVETLPEGSPQRVILTVAELDGSMRELGSLQWDRAVRTWAKCVSENHWPAYGTIRVSAPQWAIAEEVGQ